MIQRIYIDTSVVGGFFDIEFMEPTKRLFKSLEKSELKFIVSDLLELELSFAPPKVRDLLSNYHESHFEKIELNEEILSLANMYISEKVVGKSSLEDCRHIATAIVIRADILASWNFKHIVNLDRIKGYNSVNLCVGYPTLEIRTPQEILKYGD